VDDGTHAAAVLIPAPVMTHLLSQHSAQSLQDALPRASQTRQCHAACSTSDGMGWLNFATDVHIAECAPNVMQHEALAVVEGHAHVPLLPGDLIATDLKTGALRLHHVQRLQACPTPSH
jgi:hypothetical protein